MNKIDLQNVIVRPIVTEKATDLKDASKFVFEVSVKANKAQVMAAIKELYPEVDVIKCNVMNVHGKKKRVRYHYGFTAGYKKAIVTLKAGQTFPFFEGV
jgi:large subunit ribosomal protein L23